MDSYKTQQNLMAKKASEKGIPNSEITDDFQRKLNQVFKENPHCAESWALGRAEYLVWKQFFPNDPWPGISSKAIQFPRAETLSSESGEIVSPDRKEISGLASRPKPVFSLKIEELLLNAAGNPTILVKYKEVLESMKERYPRERLEWQQWMSGSQVWKLNFHQKGTFPCNEPSRSYDLSSSDNQLHPGRSAGGGSTGGQSVIHRSANRHRSRSRSSGPMGKVEFRQRETIRSGETTRQGGLTTKLEGLRRYSAAMRPGDSMAHPELTYSPKEREMELKALKIGGDDLRHAFFRALQRSRDIVRVRHPGYDRSLRHWHADQMTWERIFKKEPFPWLNDKPGEVPLLDDKSSGKHIDSFSMVPPPSQRIARKTKTKTLSPARNDLISQQIDRYPPAYDVPRINLNHSSHSKNSFGRTEISGGSNPFGSSPEGPRRLLRALPSKRADPVEGTREVTIRKNTIFRALLGDWDDSFKSVQRALGVTIKYNDDESEHLKLTIEPYQPGDNAALEKAHKFLEIWKRLIYSDQLIKPDHFWAQYKNHDKATTIDCQPKIHVNGKKILCAGKFGDLCEFFSHQIQTYQSTMAEFVHTEDALACSALFEARPYNIYLTSYPLPILLEVDTKTRNKILDEHDAFLEEWVRSSIKRSISLSDMSNDYARRRDQNRTDMDLDLDDLLKEGAENANRKRKLEVDEGSQSERTEKNRRF
ncbi:hypothetical protein NHQ30_003229 [Ciborinia camelliae]|nr:hypothetical protein NHQ30_003229 [Ciborinia camelliae]